MEDEMLEQFVFTDDGTFDKMLDSELFRQIRDEKNAKSKEEATIQK